MLTDLTPEDLGGFLDEPRVAILATLRRDGPVLLSPVWHEWRDGGFNMWIRAEDVKIRHPRRDPRATAAVAESEPPLRESRFGVTPDSSMKVFPRRPGASRPGTSVRNGGPLTWRRRPATT
jgi:hypothetical protein